MLRKLNANPIAQFELYHRRPPVRRRWRKWLRTGYFSAMLFMSMLLYWSELGGALMGRDPTPIGAALTFNFPVRSGFLPISLPTIYAVLVLLTHFSFMARASNQALFSTLRDQRNPIRWEMTLLTGVDTGTWVVGKWWAVVRWMWRDFLLLAVLRLGAVAWLAGNLSRVQVANSIAGKPFAFGEVIQPGASDILLMGVILIVMTMGMLPMLVANSVNQAVMPRLREKVFQTILLRLVFAGCILILMGIPLVIGTTLLLNVSTQSISHALYPLVFGIIDNGYILSGGLATYVAPVYDPMMRSREFYHIAADEAVLVCGLLLCLYATLTIFYLRFARWAVSLRGIVGQREVTRVVRLP